MKKSYLTWNREAVSDEEIFTDMKTLSGGVLEVNPDLKLPETKDILAKNRPPQKKKNGGKKKHTITAKLVIFPDPWGSLSLREDEA